MYYKSYYYLRYMYVANIRSSESQYQIAVAKNYSFEKSFKLLAKQSLKLR